LGSLTNFSKWKLAKTIFSPYRIALLLAGSNKSPMSAYFPIIIALKNDFDLALTNEALDAVLGAGT